MSENDNLLKLKVLYTVNETAKTVLDYFGNRERNANVTKVDRLFSVLESSNLTVSRWNLVKVLRELTDLGYGRFIVGRKGHASRVEWEVRTISLGKAAAGTTEKIEPADRDVADVDDVGPNDETGMILQAGSPIDMMRVRYPLRADLEVEMSLPKNLTRREAERLSDFIKTLPFEESSSTK
jgi:hypothetical protein